MLPQDIHSLRLTKDPPPNHKQFYIADYLTSLTLITLFISLPLAK